MQPKAASPQQYQIIANFNFSSEHFFKKCHCHHDASIPHTHQNHWKFQTIEIVNKLHESHEKKLASLVFAFFTCAIASVCNSISWNSVLISVNFLKITYRYRSTWIYLCENAFLCWCNTFSRIEKKRRKITMWKKREKIRHWKKDIGVSFTSNNTQKPTALCNQAKKIHISE